MSIFVNIEIMFHKSKIFCSFMSIKLSWKTAKFFSNASNSKSFHLYLWCLTYKNSLKFILLVLLSDFSLSDEYTLNKKKNFCIKFYYWQLILNKCSTAVLDKFFFYTFKKNFFYCTEKHFFVLKKISSL